MKKPILLLLLLLNLTFTNGAIVESISVPSAKMGREIATTIIIPDGVGDKKIPTIYLLHGYGGDETAWMKVRDMRPIADRYGVLVVCPDGENSWYWDSPTNEKSQFETFVSKELPQYIDTHYPTIPDRTARAITGYSMGGHGAMWCAIHNSEVFGAVGSLSGGLDIRPFPKSWKMAEQIGSAENSEVWDRYTCFNALDSLKDDKLAITIDCGVDDFFIEVNRNTHKKLLEMNIKHDYTERPGAHTRGYWNNAILYQTQFFNEYFTDNAKLRELKEKAEKGIAQISNGILTVEINRHGAELSSIISDDSGREFLWQGDPSVWRFRAPVLFPIVGALNKNTLRQDGKEYTMTQHGFGRDMEFEIINYRKDEVIFRLESNDSTREKYPYEFALEIGYKLKERDIVVTYRVINPTTEEIYFQIGAHPGFNYKEYDTEAEVQGYLKFDDEQGQGEILSRFINDKGLLNNTKKSFKLTDKMIEITKNTFDDGALILEDGQAKVISLLDRDKNPYVKVTFDTPVVGIWSINKEAYSPFVCIEPWFGRCDAANYKGDYSQKDWIQSLEGNSTFETNFSIWIGK